MAETPFDKVERAKSIGDNLVHKMRSETGSQVAEPEPVNQEARPDVMLTFLDSEGREWLGAAFLGELERYEGVHVAERASVHDLRFPDLVIFNVVERG